MGKIHIATCKCGHHEIVRVGGNRRTFTTNSVFPFYCDKCGLVSVNFRDTPIHCPKCESLDVKQYKIGEIIKLYQTFIANFVVYLSLVTNFTYLIKYMYSL
jgi:hypothetical protein